MTRLSFYLLMLGIAFPATAQHASFSDHQYRSERPVGIQRLNGPIDLDGRVDEPAWDAITPVPWHVYGPSYGAPSTQKTEFRVAYDDEYIYFSCDCHDTDASDIRTTTYKRDAWEANYDQVGIGLDTFNDKENSLYFIISAAGVRIDVAISDDAQGEAPYNISWNAFWDGETTINDDGWVAEVRIPLSSIRFNTVNGESTMGLTLMRYIGRSGEHHAYPERTQDWGFWSFVKPSLAQEIVFKGIESTRPIYFTPYVLAGSSRSARLNDAETKYEIDKGPTLDVGLDLKVGLTRNLTLDLTANTDFAQVEADDQQVNLTRFSLFFPERRLFFQERKAAFELNFGQSNRLFYTRQIGINDGEMVTLLGGARLVGRIGRWDVGALTMQSAHQDDLPSENFGVLRLRRQVINSNSYAGAIMTSRIDQDGGENIGLGADGIFRLRGEDYLTLAAVHTFDEETEAGLDATRLRAHLRREKLDGLTYDLEFNRAGKDYRPDLGFEQRDDYSQVGIGLGFGRVGAEGRRFKRFVSALTSDAYVTNETGRLQTRETMGMVEALSWKDAKTTAKATWFVENLDDSFDLSDDIEISTGRYSFVETELGFESWETRPATVKSKVIAGTYFDGSRISFQAVPKWNMNKVVELSGTYQYDRITFDDRDLTFNAHTARVKLGLTFSRTLSLSSFVQYSSDADLALGNFRLRYNPREGNDLFIVFNEGLNLDRFDRTPVPPYVNARTLVMKYSYTFQR